MKKALLLILTAVIVLPLLFSCGNKKKKPLEISEEEALAVLTELVPLSHEFNVIFFGDGLPVVKYDGEPTDTAYYEVDVSKTDYTTIASIKKAVERIYSKRYLDSVYVNMFIGSQSTSADGLLDNDVSPRYKEIQGKLNIDVSYNKLDIMGRLTVVSSEIVKKTHEYVSVKALCLDENGNEINKQFFITKENGVWLLDGPTY